MIYHQRIVRLTGRRCPKDVVGLEVVNQTLEQIELELTTTTVLSTRKL